MGVSLDTFCIRKYETRELLYTIIPGQRFRFYNEPGIWKTELDTETGGVSCVRWLNNTIAMDKIVLIDGMIGLLAKSEREMKYGTIIPETNEFGIDTNNSMFHIVQLSSETFQDRIHCMKYGTIIDKGSQRRVKFPKYEIYTDGNVDYEASTPQFDLCLVTNATYVIVFAKTQPAANQILLGKDTNIDIVNRQLKLLRISPKSTK